MFYKHINAIRERTPWIGIVLSYAGISESTEIPTAATDGKHVYVNLTFFSQLSFAHQLGILVHEALHIILRHVFRVGDRDKSQFNIAADHAVNYLVGLLGYKLPAGGLEPIPNMTAEQLYRQHEQDKDNPYTPDFPQFGKTTDDGDSGNSGDSAGDNSGGDSAAGGDDMLDYPLEDGQSMADAEREVADMIAKAQVAAAICGEGAGKTEREIFAMSEPTVDWPDELAEFINKAGAADYSLAPPNMVLADHGIIANRLNPSGCGNVVIVADNSGSMAEDIWERLCVELQSALDNIDYESIRIIGCDWDVNIDREFMRGDELDFSDMLSGGGTRFNPAFEHAEQYNPDLLLYFTDMEVNRHNAPTEQPAYPVVWCVFGDQLDDDGDWVGDYYFSPDWGHRIKVD